jgi:predicted RNA-binding protein with PUA-like domain
VAKKKSQPAGGWLFKQEPSDYSYADLERDGQTVWEGVKNPLARKHLRKVKTGDRVLFYHTGKERAIVGEMKILQGFTPDLSQPESKEVVVSVAPVRRWPVPLGLDRIKTEPSLKDWELVRFSRLSVMPVSPEQWEKLEELGGLGT